MCHTEFIVWQVIIWIQCEEDRYLVVSDGSKHSRKAQSYFSISFISIPLMSMSSRIAWAEGLMKKTKRVGDSQHPVWWILNEFIKFIHSGLWFLIKCFNYVDWVLFFKCWTHNSSVYKLEIYFLLLLLLWVKQKFISSTFISAIYQVILKRENTTREQHPCKSLVFIVSLNWPWLWFSLSILVILKLFVYTVLYVLLNKTCCPCRINTAQWSHHTEHISQPDSYTP